MSFLGFFLICLMPVLMVGIAIYKMITYKEPKAFHYSDLPKVKYMNSYDLIMIMSVDENGNYVNRNITFGDLVYCIKEELEKEELKNGQN